MARTDYYYDEHVPKPNSIKPAAAVAIFDEQDRLLLLKRKDNDKWTMPGGTMDFGESLTDCAIREVKEETGLDIVIIDIVGIYTDPNILIEYSDGEVRQEFTVLYLGKASDYSKVVIDDESKESQWVELDQIRRFEFAPSQVFRIQDLERLYCYSLNKLRSSIMPSKKIKEAYDEVRVRSGGWEKAPSTYDMKIKSCIVQVVQKLELNDEEEKLLKRRVFNTEVNTSEKLCMLIKKYAIFFWKTLMKKKLVVLGAASGSFLILKGMFFLEIETGSLWYCMGIITSTLIAMWPLITSARESCKEKDKVKKSIILSVGFIVIVWVAIQLSKEFTFFVNS